MKSYFTAFCGYKIYVHVYCHYPVWTFGPILNTCTFLWDQITIELSIELKNLVVWIAGVDTVNVTSCFKGFTLCFLLFSQYCRLAITWSVWKERGRVSHVLHFPVFLARLSNNSYVTNVILTSGVSVDLKYFFYSWKVVWNSRLKKWKSQEPQQRGVYENTKEM